MATFAVTVQLVEDRFFAERGLTGAPRGTVTCEELIAEIGAEVSQRLRAVNVDPGAITEATPDSYSWCQTSVLYGVAGELPRRLGWDTENADAWEEKYRQRLADLSRDPNSVLKDAQLAAGQGDIRYCFV